MTEADDYDVIIMRLFKRACGVGMAPNDFWDSEPADSSQYIEFRSEEDRRTVYSNSVLSAQMFAITLGNAFRKEGTPPNEYPGFDEVYGYGHSEEKQDSGQERLDRRIAELRMQFAGRLAGGQNNG